VLAPLRARSSTITAPAPSRDPPDDVARAGHGSPDGSHKVDSRGIYARGASADVREGVSSFLEKRPAKFPMKVSDGMPPYFPWWKSGLILDDHGDVIVVQRFAR